MLKTSKLALEQLWGRNASSGEEYKIRALSKALGLTEGIDGTLDVCARLEFLAFSMISSVASLWCREKKHCFDWA